MTTSFKPILTEFFWLAIAFIVAAFICYFLFDWDARGAIVDPQRSDTYFVISTGTIVPPIFLLVTFVLYFIKEIRNRFSRKVPNTIALVTGLLLIILLAFANKSIIVLGTNYGWTAYPPLSMVPQVGPEGPELNPFAAGLANALTVLQILVTLALLYLVFHWGRGVKESN